MEWALVNVQLMKWNAAPSHPANEFHYWSYLKVIEIAYPEELIVSKTHVLLSFRLRYWPEWFKSYNRNRILLILVDPDLIKWSSILIRFEIMQLWSQPIVCQIIIMWFRDWIRMAAVKNNIPMGGRVYVGAGGPKESPLPSMGMTGFRRFAMEYWSLSASPPPSIAYGRRLSRFKSSGRTDSNGAVCRRAYTNMSMTSTEIVTSMLGTFQKRNPHAIIGGRKRKEIVDPKQLTDKQNERNKNQDNGRITDSQFGNS